MIARSTCARPGAPDTASGMHFPCVLQVYQILDRDWYVKGVALAVVSVSLLGVQHQLCTRILMHVRQRQRVPKIVGYM